MTFELKIRPPANNTLGQLSVKYKKTPLSLFTELSRAFPEIDWSTRDLFHIFNNHRLPFGHLIITDRIYNFKTHFLKSVEPEFLCDQKLANELARFAAQYCNYIVNPCTPPKTLEWEGITFCIEYSLWENLGEIPLDPNYFIDIGKDLAFFHRILRDFPKRKLIRRNSEIYFKKMNSTWSDLLNYRQSELPGPDPKQLLIAPHIHSHFGQSHQPRLQPQVVRPFDDHRSAQARHTVHGNFNIRLDFLGAI